jgi:GT2 family glycosyltransferase
MTVHVIIPVYNRLEMTKSIVACLRAQKVREPLHIIVVNDGSSDGSAEWLAKQDDIEILGGDGSLFWGGAVDLALRHLALKAAAQDWVLLLNNDTTVSPDFVQCLLDAAQAHAPAAIGSVIRDQSDSATLLSIGPRVDAWRISVSDLLIEKQASLISESVVEVDALSGRGVLFPLASLMAAGGMRPRILPHYLADYELSVRVRKCGWRLLVAANAAVYSTTDYGNLKPMPSLWATMFSIRSPKYLPSLVAFWWGVSTWGQRLTMPFRLPLKFLFPRLRKNLLFLFPRLRKNMI